MLKKKVFKKNAFLFGGNLKKTYLCHVVKRTATVGGQKFYLMNLLNIIIEQRNGEAQTMYTLKLENRVLKAFAEFGAVIVDEFTAFEEGGSTDTEQKRFETYTELLSHLNASYDAGAQSGDFSHCTIARETYPPDHF